MSPVSSPPARGRWLTLNIVFQLAFGLVAMTICLPSMQEWPRQFGTTQAMVQLTFSAYIAAYGGLQLVYGPVSDRVGRKPVLIFGLLLSLAGSVMAALAPDIGALIAARALQGAGTAACMVIGRALVQDLYEPHERTRVMALFGMVLGLCPPLATLLGGQLHVRLGWQSNFVLLAVASGLLALAAWRGLPATRPTRPGGRWSELASGYAQLARLPSFMAYVGILAMTTATFYAFLGGAPIVLGSFGVRPEHIGWYIMATPLAYMAGNILTVRLTGRVRERRLMQVGQALTVLGPLITVLAALAGVHSPLALALPMMVLGIGHGLLVPPALVGTVGLVPALAGSASALAGLSQQFGGSLAGYAVGLVEHQGSLNLGLMMLAWAAVGTGFLVWLHRIRGRESRTRPPRPGP